MQRTAGSRTEFVPEPGLNGIIAPANMMLLGDLEVRRRIGEIVRQHTDFIPAGRYMDVAHLEVFDAVLAGMEATWAPLPLYPNAPHRNPTMASLEGHLESLSWSVVVYVGYPRLYTDAECLSEGFDTRRGVIRPGWRAVCKTIGDRSRRYLLAVWAEARGVPAEDRAQLDALLTLGHDMAFRFYLHLMANAGLGGAQTLNEALGYRWIDRARIDPTAPTADALLPLPRHLQPAGTRDHLGAIRARLVGDDYSIGFAVSESSEEEAP